MSKVKTDENQQFARVSTDGNRQYTQADNDGTEPLADDNGRLITRLALANGFVDALNPLPVSATLTIPNPLPVIITEPDRILAASGPTYTPAAGLSIGTPGIILYSFYGYHDNPVPCYLQLFNMAGLPVSGVTIPLITIPLGAGPGIMLPDILTNSNLYPSAGFSLGLAWALSSTRAVFTNIGTAYLNAFLTSSP